MKNQKGLLFATSLLLLLSVGCSSKIKKIKKERDLTTECYESLKLVKSLLERSPDGKVLQLKSKYLINSDVRTNKINEIKESFFSNVIDCWSKNFTQADILRLFGKPTKEVIGQRTGELSYEYVILNKLCAIKDGKIVGEFDCGQLRFTFSKEGIVNNGMIFLSE
ncbi:MAG: hypothetical protein K9J37_14005 [Saprospiraceae bacterium]|nr:hypothetical protein [Saprospiraceae bacterium]MCF8251020.1 hypothetical protein [Saprospiraceae bacterium]MCF8281476.1 hypothetical protein [Bacteroidales bacterium]MCF8311617.1 hypothetical protein [Saprospiraceae bacterium]MCF8440958.1 hypothetical protein [Saprospiraceae bacterium]